MALTKAHNRIIAGSALNVLDFGATGDGTTDDTVAIQAAIDKAETTGNDVIFPAGTYLMKTITIGDNVGLVGLRGATISVGVLSDYLIKNKDTTNGNDDIRICGLKFEGNSATSGNYSLITLTKCTHTFIENNEFNDSKNFSISLFGGTSKVVVQNNNVHDGQGGGINVNGTTESGTKVIGNRVYNHVASGIVIQGNASRVIVSENDCSYNGTTNGNGISVGNSTNCIISNNICRYNSYTAEAGSGIGVNPTTSDCLNHVITGNICEYNGDDGIDIACSSPRISKYHTVSSNQLKNNKNTGVNLGGTGDVEFITIMNNFIFFNGAAGIQNDSGGDGYHVMIGNIICDNGQTTAGAPAIRNYDTYNLVMGNLARNIGTITQGGISATVNGQDGTVVIGNHVSRASGDAYALSAGNDLLSGFNYGGAPFKSQTNINTISGATPDVSDGKIFNVTQTGATNVTGFANPQMGQEIILRFRDGNSTLINSSTLRIDGGANFAATTDDVLYFFYDGTAWNEISRK